MELRGHIEKVFFVEVEAAIQSEIILQKCLFQAHWRGTVTRKRLALLQENYLQLVKEIEENDDLQVRKNVLFGYLETI